MLKKIKRYLKLFLFFSYYSFKITFRGRMGVVIFIIAKTMRFLFFFSLIFLIFQKTKVIKGYSLAQASVFYLTFNIIDIVSQIMFREVYRFRPLVISGDFDLVLTKPFHPFIKILFGGVDFLDMIMVIPYLIITIIVISRSGSIPFFNLSLYVLLVLNGLIIATSFHILVLALGLLTTEVDQTIMIYRDLSRFGLFPFDIYKEPLRGFLTFIIPIGIMMYFPVRVLFNSLSWQLLLVSFLVSFSFLFVSMKFWGRSLKNYQSWGG